MICNALRRMFARARSDSLPAPAAPELPGPTPDVVARILLRPSGELEVVVGDYRMRSVSAMIPPSPNFSLHFIDGTQIIIEPEQTIYAPVVGLTRAQADILISADLRAMGARGGNA